MAKNISYEVVLNNQKQEVNEAEIAKEQLNEVFSIFTKNPILQIVRAKDFDLALELSSALFDKDYSQLLFKMIRDLHVEITKV